MLHGVMKGGQRRKTLCLQSSEPAPAKSHIKPSDGEIKSNLQKAPSALHKRFAINMSGSIASNENDSLLCGRSRLRLMTMAEPLWRTTQKETLHGSSLAELGRQEVTQYILPSQSGPFPQPSTHKL